MKLKKTLALVLAFVMLVSCFATGAVASPDVAAGNPIKPTKVPYRNVMYYGDWSVYGGQHNFDPCDMQGNLLTHLNFAFMDFDANGDLVLCDKFADFEKGLKDQAGMPYGGPYTGVFGGMLALRDKNPNLKLGVSVGGWTRCGDFPAVCASDAKRANLVNNLVKFVDYVGFDYIDIDWEYPGSNRKPDPEGSGVTIDEGCPGGAQDKQNFTKLMRDLRAGLDKLGQKNGKYYELSAAMGANPANINSIEYDKVLQYADFLNMMTYDLNGAWAPFTAHQSPLYTNPAAENLYDLDTNAGLSIDSTIKLLKSKYPGIDLSKIVVGVCAYTRGWGGVHAEGYAAKEGQANCPGLFATSTPNSIVAPDKTTSGTWGYGDVHELASRYNLKEYWDDVAKAPYLYSPGTGKDDGYFFTYDNVRSVKLKGQYVRENGLGGLICWMASQDPQEELTIAMKESLYGSAPIPQQPIIVGKADATVKVSAAENGQIQLTLVNNSKAVERNEALAEAEKYQKTIMLPKLYINTKNGTTFRAGMMAGTVSGNTVDLSPVYDASTLKAGTSHTFTLVPSDPNFKISDIENIVLTQRMNKQMHEFGAQIVYGSDENPVPTEPTVPVTTAPVTEPTVPVTTAPVTEPTVPVTTAPVTEPTVPVTTAPVTEPTVPVTTAPATEPTVPETTAPHKDGDILPEHMVTGYWHNFINGSKNLKLSDVPQYYDMICVAFTGNTGTNGVATFEIDPDLARALGGYTKAEFIQDIKDLQKKDQHVIISVGGAEGRISISSDADAERFYQSMSKIIREYGFEGIDIDLEGGAVSGTKYIASALRKLHNEFGEDFIITMAPETFYVMNTQGSYAKLAMEIKDILTICYPQFYNTGSMNGYQGTVVFPGTADMMTSMSTTLIEDCGLRPDQIGFGVPAMGKAAGSGFYTISEIEKAVHAFVNGTSSGNFTAPRAYPEFRSMMTWSINWDATQNYSWGRAMDRLMASLPTSEGGSEVVPEPTTEPTTEATTRPTTAPTVPETTAPVTEPTVPVTTAPVTEPTVPVTTAPATEPTVPETTTAPTDPVIPDGEWAPYVAYTKGQIVSYKGIAYECRTSHTSLPNWEPSNVPALWLEVSGAVDPDPTTPTEPDPTDPVDPQPGDTWQSNKVYSGGDVVVYNGQKYVAKWWTLGEKPDPANKWGVWKVA